MGVVHGKPITRCEDHGFCVSLGWMTFKSSITSGAEFGPEIPLAIPLFNC
jgi:hypothetical protein